jgi:hypothetical protein
MFQVVKLSDLAIIIEHFKNFPLKTQKHADYLLFEKAFNVVSNKQHLSEIGLQKLISIRASLNKGLPERLQIAFPGIIPTLRPEVPKTVLNSKNLGDKY